MQICLFRHAERESRAGEFSSDPQLTKLGHRQAQHLLELILENKLPQANKLLVSPRTRTRQTFQVVANHYGLELNVVSELDERANSENNLIFCKRIQRFLTYLEKTVATSNNSCLYICTHFDWVEEALSLIPSSDSTLSENASWAPGQYILFEIHDGLWTPQKKGVLSAHS